MCVCVFVLVYTLHRTVCTLLHVKSASQPRLSAAKAVCVCVCVMAKLI